MIFFLFQTVSIKERIKMFIQLDADFFAKNKKTKKLVKYKGILVPTDGESDPMFVSDIGFVFDAKTFYSENTIVSDETFEFEEMK